MSHKYGERRYFTGEGYVNTVREDGSVYIETNMLNKEKSIIEKLEIEYYPWTIIESGRDYKVVDKHGNIVSQGDTLYNEPVNHLENEARLIATAPEMLGALIDLIKYLEDTYPSIADCVVSADDISVIQKATGKSWKEIKELL